MDTSAVAARIAALAVELGHALVARHLVCATAESCTGGLVAGAITAVAGSSQWFERGFVTYADDAKSEMLGVPADTIDAHGAVSEPTARAMAEGALARAGADVSVAITGVAGPGGGTAAKPVGMVCLGWAGGGKPTRVVTRHFPGNREAIRLASVAEALAGLRDQVV